MHNQFRAKHQVGSLSWNSGLQASAQQWADQCVFQHSGPGENLAQYFSNFESVTQAWYDEVKDYHWDGQFSYATGHFTEVRQAQAQYIIVYHALATSPGVLSMLVCRHRGVAAQRGCM